MPVFFEGGSASALRQLIDDARLGRELRDALTEATPRVQRRPGGRRVYIIELTEHAYTTAKEVIERHGRPGTA